MKRNKKIDSIRRANILLENNYILLYEDIESGDLSTELNSFSNELERSAESVNKELINLIKQDEELKNKVINYDKSKDDEVTEGVLVGIALSSGAIIGLVGKLLKYAGKTLSNDDTNKLKKIGIVIEKYGHDIHHSIIKVINTLLKPLIFWLPKEKQEKVSNIIFMAILAWKLSTASLDVDDYKSILGFTEGLLNSIKATEISLFIRSVGVGLVELIKSA
jgi:hypothetical protein